MDIWGIHHPPRPEDGTSNTAPVAFDFMLSVIPPEDWARCARFTIRLKHEHSSVAEVANTISASGADLVHTEATRSAHRYGTWNFTVVFRDIDISKCHLNKSRSYYKQVNAAAKVLKKTIKEECKEVLFRDLKERKLKKPVFLHVNSALTYFHLRQLEVAKSIRKLEAAYNKLLQKKEASKEELKSIQVELEYYGSQIPFKLRALTGSDLAPDDDFKDRLNKIARRNGLDSKEQIASSHLFAEMDTKDVNIRLAIFPRQSDAKRFFGIRATWELEKAHVTDEGSLATSRGLLGRISEHFPDSWNIWKVGARQLTNSKHFERGRINYLVESSTANQSLDGHSNYLNQEVNRPLPGVIALNEVHADMLRANSRSFINDVVVSCASDNYDDGGQFIQELSELGYAANLLKDIDPGATWHQSVFNAIRDCKVVLVLVQDQLEVDGRSLGVRDEVIAALALEKLIVPVAYGKHKNYNFDRLPSYFRGQNQGFKFCTEPVNKRQTVNSLERIRFQISFLETSLYT